MLINIWYTVYIDNINNYIPCGNPKFDGATSMFLAMGAIYLHLKRLEALAQSMVGLAAGNPEGSDARVSSGK